MGFYKLNCDGASKGSHDLVGYGCIIRDQRGSMLGFKYGNIGWETKNMVEIEGLLQGMEMAKDNEWTPIIVEGDS